MGASIVVKHVSVQLCVFCPIEEKFKLLRLCRECILHKSEKKRYDKIPYLITCAVNDN